MPARSPGSKTADGFDLVGPDEPQWTAFVSHHPAATCFHQPAWLETLTSAYGFRAGVALQRDADGAVVAGMPLVEVRRPTGRRWMCLPFSDECGPLVAPGVSATPLVVQVEALRREGGIGDLQVRTGLDIPGAASRQVAVTHELALSGPVEGGARPGRARASVRRHLATAERRGVQVSVAQTLPDISTYYRLHVQTRRRQGVPAQPRSYFRALWERMIAPGHGFVLIAHQGDRPVAGAVYLLGGRTVTYKYGASDSTAWALRPNHPVMARAIAWATERGYATFDFGRTDLDNQGLMQFKESWGAQRRPLCYTSFSGSVRHRAALPLQGLTGTVIRRSPPVVCRAVGELLYRYAA